MDAILRDFLKFLEYEKGYAENTIAAYQNDLSQFMTYLKRQGQLPWAEVDKVFIDRYVSSLPGNDYTSSTIARKVAALKSFFHYLIAEKVVEHDPTASLDLPKVKKQLPKTISLEEVNRLLQVTRDGDHSRSTRDQAMLELLYVSGMRVTELVSLNIDDLDFENGAVRVRSKKGDIRERFIPLTDKALDVLWVYTSQGRPELVRDRRSSALFLNHRGQRLTRQGSWLIIKRYVQAVGISDEVTPHTLRHSFAAHKLSTGKSLQDIQKLLGHANISTTQIYAHLANEQD